MKCILKNFLVVFAVLAVVCGGAFAQEKSSTKASAKSDSSATAKAPKPGSETDPDTISKAQDALKTKGLYKGDASGKMDAATKDAVKAFQQKEGLKPTGRLNKDTRQALGIEAGGGAKKSAPKKRGKSKAAEN